MSDYWFYHLESATLEGVLPDLLEKTLARNWRALVFLPGERVEAMDEWLWTWKDDAFLPHGRDDEPMADRQPVLLSGLLDKTEGFDCAFLIGRDDIEISDTTERVIVIIDGRNEEDLSRSRAYWSKLKKEGKPLSYWQQDERGRWAKKA